MIHFRNNIYDDSSAWDDDEDEVDLNAFDPTASEYEERTERNKLLLFLIAKLLSNNDDSKTVEYSM